MSIPLIARSFMEASSELTAAERALCFDFIRKIAVDPSQPSISLERVTRARSENVWSGRVSSDLRAVMHKDSDGWALLYVAHHDDAYDWASRREIGPHSRTGVLQVVETIETVREVVRTVVRTVEEERPARVEPPPLAGFTPVYLHSLGVPEAWIDDLRAAPNVDDLLDLASRLPQDVAERLLALASGEPVEVPTPILPGLPITASPDACRSFFVADGEDELRAALDAPWAQWIGFLHPSQRAITTGSFGGPVLVTGSAGTGKTVVAMHRARQMARAGKRVLLTTFVGTLCQNVERALRLFCTDEERQRIKVATVHSVALALVRKIERSASPAADKDIHEILEYLAPKEAPDFELSFVQSEWENVIRAQGIATWDEYAGARRTGRGRALSQKDRRQLWGVFGGVLESLTKRNLYDWTFLCVRARELLAAAQVTSPYDVVIVDELQDLRSPEIRFLAALSPGGTDALMLAGDAGQRIYPGGFSLKALGIDVRGRSKILRVNYRTTDQIRRTSDRLLDGEVADEDQALPARRGTLSLVRGPEPRLLGFDSDAEERAFVLDRIQQAMQRGFHADEIGVFVRTNVAAEALQKDLMAGGAPAVLLNDKTAHTEVAVRVGTMHRAKGLEFRMVFVLGAAEGRFPDTLRMAQCADDAEREDFVARERRLLYVAMTRAREELTVTWSGKPSPYLDAVTGTAGRS